MCLKCNRSFSTPQQAKVHFKEIHVIDRNDRKFNCHLCSKSFAIKRYLSNHLRATHGLSQTLLKHNYMPNISNDQHQWFQALFKKWNWKWISKTVRSNASSATARSPAWSMHDLTTKKFTWLKDLIENLLVHYVTKLSLSGGTWQITCVKRMASPKPWWKVAKNHFLSRLRRFWTWTVQLGRWICYVSKM